jgi:hypothetical protein
LQSGSSAESMNLGSFPTRFDRFARISALGTLAALIVA